MPIRMKPAIVILILAAVVFTSACGANAWRTSTQLWEDVPEMDGLAQVDMEMPEEALEVISPVLRTPQQWRMTVVAFTTERSPQELRDFYTVDRMTQTGWKTGWSLDSIPGCQFGGNSVITKNGEGIVCRFSKEQDSKQVILTVLATVDEELSKTTVFFARVNDPW